LSEIIQQQRRQHQPKPGLPNCGGADMAHIGVQRLAAGERQKYRADHHERDLGVSDQEICGLGRIDRLENSGCEPDVGRAQPPNDNEPYHHDGTEQLANAASAVLLDHE
jgi:hypothetical protein